MQAPDLDKATLEQFVEFERIGNRAVRRAQEESRRLGVPNVYSIGGVLHYERPDGSLTTEDLTAEPHTPNSTDRPS
ncbi:MAG: hypothetical protein AAGI91_10220 [Bacteroidota bacterium]